MMHRLGKEKKGIIELGWKTCMRSYCGIYKHWPGYFHDALQGAWQKRLIFFPLYSTFFRHPEKFVSSQSQHTGILDG